MSNAEQDYYAEIVELREQLEKAESERDQYIERCDDLQTVQLRLVEELARVEKEARLARTSAKRNRELRRKTYAAYLDAIRERHAAQQAAAFVYEVVDHTDDEVYHTIGIWPTLEAALEMVRQFADNPDGLERNGYIDDYCRVTVNRRPVGEASDSGTQVREFVWAADYNEEADEYNWKMQEIKGHD